ncbi:ribonuclease P Rpr2/Rpp21/SNM1 subunit [Rhodotorula paludigena]|uniref:ribonuclease P Rpr2/Rpp21/SNM1 subunit n=1 Tax=Rhodotorula paludigena TaxID=86838 RepID=UPI00316F3F23
MAKKGRGAPSEPTAAAPVVNRDSLQRLSYLYQASVLLQSAGVQSSSSSTTATSTQQIARRNRSPPWAQSLEKDVKTDEAGAEAQTPQRPTKQRRRTTEGQATSLQPLARHLAAELSEVSQKATIRMDPAVKRSVCKGCKTVLVAGLTSSVRIKPSGPHAHVVVHCCLSCRAQRRLPAPPHLLSPDASHLSAMDEAAAPRLTKRERREARQAREPVFFERPGHVVVRAGAVLSQDEYRST